MMGHCGLAFEQVSSTCCMKPRLVLPEVHVRLCTVGLGSDDLNTKEQQHHVQGKFIGVRICALFINAVTYINKKTSHVQ